MNYFKILVFLQRGDKSLFEIPLNKQKAYLGSLGEAKDDIDRGYKQYLCQNFFRSSFKIVLFNIIAFFAVPALMVVYLFKGAVRKKGEHVDTILERKGMNEVIPLILSKRYNLDERYWHENSSLSFYDIPFLFSLIFKAPHHPYFTLKSMANIAYYSDMISRHQPKTIIQFGEFSFCSSILTDYCHHHNVEHINVMHGEKLWHIYDAFFHYDECYVWDEHYVNLFRFLKAEPNQFIVALPESMHIKCENYKDESCYADYKYYLADNSEIELRSVVKSLSFVKSSGKSMKFRPHPRYTDMNLLRQMIAEEDIEDNNTVSILSSISNCEYAIGSYTTVLSQAYFSGKKVIMDDVTYKDQYDKLKSMGYILAGKDVEVLSNLMKG